MGAETIVTLVGVFLAVAAVAVSLIIIAVTLNKVSFMLGTILIGVRSIASQTQPLGSVVGDILKDVTAIEGALDRLVNRGNQPVRRTRSRR
jgi:uncharacterized membrane protein YkgB